MYLGACVSLLEKCHPLDFDRMQQEKTKVAHFAKVTRRSDRKTFFLATTCHFNLPACFLTMLFVSAFFPIVFQVERGSVQSLWKAICIM